MSKLDDEISDVVKQQIAADMARQIERELLSAVMSSNIEPTEQKPFRLDEHLPKLEQMFRESRRNQITVIVDMALRYDAPLLMEQTPCDGQRIEMSHRQANEVSRVRAAHSSGSAV